MPFIVAYIAASITIIEFMDFSSERFNIAEGTIVTLYIISAALIPLVIVLPWFINKKSKQEMRQFELTADHDEIKELKHNFPVRLTRFIGRKSELIEIRTLIKEHRLLTITGSGGCGKTRLVCEAIKGMEDDFSGGIWFVDLAPVLLEELVNNQIAETLGIHEIPGQDLIDTIGQKIQNEKLLIVLDNCEHLIRTCSSITSKLVQLVPGLSIIATSREALKIAGEKVWRIPSLSLLHPESEISLEKAHESEAIEIFVNRAQLVNPEFQMDTNNVREISEICTRLDGIPLALEIVASRIQFMSPREILDRLSDRFGQLASSNIHTSERQKTLDGTIAWGYQLLSEDEQLLFSRLCVFFGGFTLLAAEEVCGDDRLTQESILNLMSNLVDKSMMFVVKSFDQKMTYNFYESLRQFGLKQLREQGLEKKIRIKHLNYYIMLSQEAYDERNRAQSVWLSKLGQEHDNLISALEFSEKEDPEAFISISGNMAWFWVWASHFQTGIKYLSKSRSINPEKRENMARVLLGSGTLALFSGDPPNAFKYLKESKEVWAELKMPEEEAICTNELSLGYSVMGEDDIALRYAEEGLELAKKAGNPETINHCKISPCQVLLSMDGVHKVMILAKEMELDAKKYDQPLVMRLAHHFQADCHLLGGRYKEAEQKYGLALEVAHSVGNMLFACIEIVGIAMSVSAQNRYAKAMRLSSAVSEIARNNGILDPANLKLTFWVELVNTHLRKINEKVGFELSQNYQAEGRTLTYKKAREYALDFKRD